MKIGNVLGLKMRVDINEMLFLREYFGSIKFFLIDGLRCYM